MKLPEDTSIPGTPTVAQRPPNHSPARGPGWSGPPTHQTAMLGNAVGVCPEPRARRPKGTTAVTAEERPGQDKQCPQLYRYPGVPHKALGVIGSACRAEDFLASIEEIAKAQHQYELKNKKTPLRLFFDIFTCP